MPRTGRKHRSYRGLVALAWLVIVIICAVVGRYFVPFSPNAQDLVHAYQAPAWGAHLLGTDQFGRDELSRLIVGSRVSLLAALIGTSTSMVIGVPLGVFAAFVGGKFDAMANFVINSLMAFPAIIFTLTVIAIIGTGLVHAMIAFGIVISPIFFRISRASVVNVQAETFVEASSSIGCSRWRIIWRHLLPNSLTPIVIQATVVSGVCIIAEAGLSFLGFSVQPPTASWGGMMSTAAQDIFQGSYLIYFPGLLIALTVLALFALGDRLREALGGTGKLGGF